MTKKQKINNAKKRVQNTKEKKQSFLKRVWNILCVPFKFIAKILCRIWNWICSLNLVGLVNTALLVAIIVLFSMLIIDISGCKKEQIIIVPENVPVTKQVVVTEEPAPHVARMRNMTLPLKNSKNSAQVAEPVNVVPVKKAEAAAVKKQVAQQNNKFWGDVIVDSRASGAMLKNNSQINGNLYLQNMRKYVLPCDIRINGNLFLRDVNMLQFCGDFVITGNIYVSPKSSFGPVPKTARLGGQVVL